MPDQDITGSLANFREAARHLWNCHYRPFLPDDPWDVRDSFDTVIGHLFASVVLEPCGIAGTQLGPSNVSEPTIVNGIFVRPSSEHGVPIMINREARRDHGYWDHPKNRIAPEDAIMSFGQFFDFDQRTYRDFRYLKVLIVSSSNDPGICDHWALLDFEYARVFASRPDAG